MLITVLVLSSTTDFLFVRPFISILDFRLIKLKREVEKRGNVKIMKAVYHDQTQEFVQFVPLGAGMAR